MATKLKYVGPPDQANEDVRAARQDGGGAMLTPGEIVSVPAELAGRLLESSSQWERVTDFDKMSKTALRAAAKAEGIPGYTTMSDDELKAALRGEPATTTEETS